MGIGEAGQARRKEQKMKNILVLLTALTLSLGSVQAASSSEAATHRSLAVWHSGEANPYRVSHAYTSLSEVVGAYWRALEALGYSGTVTETAQGGSSYLFTGALGQLEAVFTLKGDLVTVTLTQPRQDPLAASATAAAGAS
jgi:hypothetical protein